MRGIIDRHSKHGHNRNKKPHVYLSRRIKTINQRCLHKSGERRIRFNHRSERMWKNNSMPMLQRSDSPFLPRRIERRDHRGRYGHNQTSNTHYGKKRWLGLSKPRKPVVCPINRKRCSLRTGKPWSTQRRNAEKSRMGAETNGHLRLTRKVPPRSFWWSATTRGNSCSPRHATRNNSSRRANIFP